MQLFCVEWRCDLGAAFVLPICRDLQNNLQIASIAAGAWNRLASVEYLYAAIARSVETRGSTAASLGSRDCAGFSRADTCLEMRSRPRASMWEPSAAWRQRRGCAYCSPETLAFSCPCVVRDTHVACAVAKHLHDDRAARATNHSDLSGSRITTLAAAFGGLNLTTCMGCPHIGAWRVWLL